MHHRTLSAALAVIGFVAAGWLVTPAAARQGGGGPPAAAVRVAAVQSRTLQERRRITGQLRAVARSRVATLEESVVVELLVQEGQSVEGGQPLAVLDSRRLRLALASLEARIEVATAVAAAREIEQELAQRDLDALEALAARAASNPKEVADKRSELAVATAKRNEAQRQIVVSKAEADLLRTRLEDTVIKAPFTGVVVTVETELGQWLDKGEAIAEIVATGRYEAWLDVPQKYARWLMAADATVLVMVEGMERPTTPATPHVIRLVDPRARTFPIYVDVEDADERLATGMSAIGWVPTGGQAEHIVVPRDALMRNQGGDFVYAVRGTGPGTGSAAPTPVTVVFETADGVAVRDGSLAAGDFVVIEGNERLFPMMPVKFEVPPGAEATRTAGGGA